MGGARLWRQTRRGRHISARAGWICGGRAGARTAQNWEAFCAAMPSWLAKKVDSSSGLRGRRGRGGGGEARVPDQEVGRRVGPGGRERLPRPGSVMHRHACSVLQLQPWLCGAGSRGRAAGWGRVDGAEWAVAGPTHALLQLAFRAARPPSWTAQQQKVSTATRMTAPAVLFMAAGFG